MRAGRLKRWFLVAAPFALLALGFVILVRSPWPAILSQLEHGRHVYVSWSWSTGGALVATAACFMAALAISFKIRTR